MTKENPETFLDLIDHITITSNWRGDGWEWNAIGIGKGFGFSKGQDFRMGGTIHGGTLKEVLEQMTDALCKKLPENYSDLK